MRCFWFISRMQAKECLQCEESWFTELIGEWGRRDLEVLSL